MSQFIDNQDGTATDSQTGLVWSKEDSWQKDGKWVTWDEAMEFARYLIDLELGGRKDWRLPTIEEAKTLFDPVQKIQDKYGKDIHIDPIFPSGPLCNIWINEIGSGNEGYYLNLTTGEIERKFKSVAGRMAARPVSDGK